MKPDSTRPPGSFYQLAERLLRQSFPTNTAEEIAGYVERAATRVQRIAGTRPLRPIHATGVHDEAWHAAVYTRYRRGVLRMLMFVLRGDHQAAEDIYQETLLTAWHKRQSVPDEPKLEAWVFTVAKAHLLNYVRRRAHRHHETLDDTMSTRLQTSSADSWIDDIAETDALASLSAEDRQILILVLGYEFRCQEAAQILGISYGSARIRLGRAKKKAQLLARKPSDKERSSDIDVPATQDRSPRLRTMDALIRSAVSTYTIQPPTATAADIRARSKAC